MVEIYSEVPSRASILWPVRSWDGSAAQGAPALPAGHAHVYAIQLDIHRLELDPFLGVLDRAELERAERFHFERDRRRYIAGRGMLRTILGRYLGIPARRVAFTYGAAGKPALAPELAGSGLYFNLAHSEDLALMALTRDAAIGVDVEQIRVLEDFDELVARFFSAREHAAFDRLKPEEKPSAFFNLWTRKEAWLKATGEGIAHSLNRVEVTFLPGEPAGLLSLPADRNEASEWELHDLMPASGFAAALATAKTGVQLECRECVARYE
jgi:4'-phosphopantetheinyl transferase